MRKKIMLLFVSSLLLISCEGERGEQGPKGDGELAKVYEISVDFTDPEYSIRYIFSESINDSDMIVMYRLDHIDNRLDVWEQLPTLSQSIGDENDTFVFYWFNFTSGDVDIFMESNNLNLVTDPFAKDQIFRIVVIPAAFAENPNLNTSNFESLMTSLKLGKNDISRIQLN